MADVAELNIRVNSNADEEAAALDRLAAAAGRTESAAQKLKREMDAASRATRQARANTVNLAQQFQDVFVSIAGGQAPMTVAMQQGTQMGVILGQHGAAGAAKALATGLLSAINPMTAISVGLIAVAGFTYRWLTSANDDLPKMNELLKEQAAIMKDLGSSYSEAAKNIEAMGRSIAEMNLRSQVNTIDLIKAQLKELKGEGASALSQIMGSNEGVGFLDRVGSEAIQGTLLGGILSGGATTAFQVNEQFAAFEEPIKRFRKSILAGVPDVDRFRKEITQTWNELGRTEELTVSAALLRRWTNSIEEASRALKELEVVRKRLMDSVGPNGMLKASGFLAQQDAASFASFNATQDVASQRRQAASAARVQSIFARSPQEIAAAVRASESAEYNKDESARDRQDRINLATIEALTAAEYRLAEARRERARVAEQTLDQQRLEISLVGQVAGAQAAARYEFEKMAELQQEAAKNNIEINKEEAASVRRTAQEYGRLAQQLAEVKLTRDLLFERDQIFRTRGDQEIASRLKGAGLEVDLESQIANMMRVNQELQRMRDTWESIFEEARDGIDSIVDALFEGGADIGEVLKQIGRDFARTLFDLSVTNPLKNWLTGSELPNISDLGIFGDGASSGRGGGFGGILGKLLGAQKAVATMQVQAAIVNINGAPLGLPGLPGLPGGIPNPLANMGMSQAQIQNRISEAFGISQETIQKRISEAFGPLSTLTTGRLPGLTQAGNMSIFRDAIAMIESQGSGGYSAIGLTHPTMGRALGRYQVMEANIPSWSKEALGRSISADEFLKSPGFQDAIFDTQFGKSISKFGNAQDAASVWFTGRPLSQGAGAADALGTTGSKYVDMFTQNVEKLSGVTQQAVTGLSEIAGSGIQVSQSLIDAAGGLSNFGSVLSSFMGSAQGGGSGWFQGLMSMFGGVGGALGHMTSISPMATAAILAGGGGLYHEGGRVGFPTQYRNVDPRIWLTAPRYHNGGVFGHDEMPAIVRKGEVISKSPQHAREMFGGGVDTDRIVAAIDKIKANVKVGNIFDKSLIGEFLRTNEGEQMVMNIVKKNPNGPRLR